MKLQNLMTINIIRDSVATARSYGEKKNSYKRLTDLNQFNKPNYCERIYYLNVIFSMKKTNKPNKKLFFLQQTTLNA